MIEFHACKASNSMFVQLPSMADVMTNPAFKPELERELARRTGQYSSTQTYNEWATGQDGTTVEDLIEWASNGWPGAPTETADIVWSDGYRDTYVLSESGTDGVDPGAYATGDPACTFEYRPALNPVPAPVRAVVNSSYPHTVPGSDVMKWAEAASIALQTIRVAGGQVDVFGCFTSRPGHTATGDRSGTYTTVFHIADSRYPLPVAIEAFLAGHPSTIRVAQFANTSSIETDGDWFRQNYGETAGHGRSATPDIFKLPTEWHDARLIPGPADYWKGYTNVYGEERGYREMPDRDEIVRDIMGALGWKVAE